MRRHLRAILMAASWIAGDVGWFTIHHGGSSFRAPLRAPAPPSRLEYEARGASHIHIEILAAFLRALLLRLNLWLLLLTGLLLGEFFFLLNVVPTRAEGHVSVGILRAD